MWHFRRMQSQDQLLEHLRFSSCCTRKCSLTLTRIAWGVVILSWCFFFFLSKYEYHISWSSQKYDTFSSQQIYELGLFCFSFFMSQDEKGHEILLMSTDFEDSHVLRYVYKRCHKCLQTNIVLQNSSKLILSKWVFLQWNTSCIYTVFSSSTAECKNLITPKKPALCFFSSWNAVPVFSSKRIHPATDAFICSCMDVMEMFFLWGD